MKNLKKLFAPWTPEQAKKIDNFKIKWLSILFVMVIITMAFGIFFDNLAIKAGF